MSATRTAAPLGVKIICVLATIGALLGLVGGFGVAAAGGIWILLGPILVLVSVAQLAAVYGLWTLQSWGWTLAMVLYGLDAAIDLVGLASGDPGSVLGLAIAVMVLAYIFGKRDLYKSRKREVPPANRI
ncbi:hypothetical protein BRD00_11645 [Halobacteriales archaeon QS_8_69_26]|nr:MAG: hypothetical protein BRD00_11645 [Halobacteriales archaeon QS_8_69_26]